MPGRDDGVVPMPPGVTVPAFLKAATDFTLPADPSAPLVMVGPGTGGGAFVSFLQRRRAVGGGGSNTACWMVYGCRRRDHDYLFRSELEALER